MPTLLDYYLGNVGFALAHLFTWLLSLLVIAWWIHVRTRIAARVTNVRPLTPPELETLLQPLEPFPSYFDFLASLFIFTGLVGTIVGFVYGLPKLLESTWNFDDLTRALSTSAAGIVFSILLNLIVLVLEGFLIHPLIANLRKTAQADPVGQYVKQLLEQHSAMLGSAISTFSTVANTLSDRIGTWTSEATQWQVSFTKAAENSLATATTIRDSLDRIKKLPTDIATSISQTVETHSRAFTTSLKNIKKAADSLEDIPKRFEEKIEPIYAALFERLEGHFKTANEQLTASRQIVDESLKRLDGVAAAVAEVLEAAKVELNASLLGQQQTFIAELKREHGALLPELRRVGTETVANQIITLDQHAQKMQGHAEDLKQARDLALLREKELLQDAIRASMGEVTGIIDQYREKLKDVELALPEELTTAYREGARGVAEAAGLATSAAERIERAVIAMGSAAGEMQKLPGMIANLVSSIPRSIETVIGSSSPPVSSPERIDPPNHESPKHESPKHESPNHESPNHESPNHESPNHESPNHESPKYESPKYESPKPSVALSGNGIGASASIDATLESPGPLPFGSETRIKQRSLISYLWPWRR